MIKWSLTIWFDKTNIHADELLRYVIHFNFLIFLDLFKGASSCFGLLHFNVKIRK